MARPTKYRKEFCKTILDKMREGASVTECCADLGIDRDTFYRWAKTHGEFSDTHRRGMILAEAYWEGVGKAGIMGREKIDAKTYAFYMKNRFKWTDRMEQTVTADVTQTSAADMPPEERDRLIAAFIEKMGGKNA